MRRIAIWPGLNATCEAFVSAGRKLNERMSRACSRILWMINERAGCADIDARQSNSFAHAVRSERLLQIFMPTGNHYEQLIVQMIECATCSRFISEQFCLDLS